jgi:hypothetical protein
MGTPHCEMHPNARSSVSPKTKRNIPRYLTQVFHRKLRSVGYGQCKTVSGTMGLSLIHGSVVPAHMYLARSMLFEVRLSPLNEKIAKSWTIEDEVGKCSVVEFLSTRKVEGGLPESLYSAGSDKPHGAGNHRIC